MSFYGLVLTKAFIVAHFFPSLNPYGLMVYSFTASGIIKVSA